MQLGDVIGGGGQGVVQRGRYKEREVALKSLPYTNEYMDNDQIVSFFQEIKILR